MYQKKLTEDIRCPLEYGINLIGGKWRSRIICLIGNIGPMHFGELKADLVNITDGVLASTLNDLIASELIQKSRSEQLSSINYSLTSKGESLIPLLQQFCRWSGSYYQKNYGNVMGHCIQCDFYRKWSKNNNNNGENHNRRISKMKFYRCENCGNIVGVVKDSGVPMMCCGKKMEELIPGTSDGAMEKHVPVYQVEGNKVSVSVGSVDHPMEEVHYIEWVALETTKGAQRKRLKPGDRPYLEFALTDDDSVLAVYEYCNLHGLWKAE